jgi:hypothetical protein
LNSKQIAIYTVTYNRLNYTRRIFDELGKTVSIPYDHYIVDNASTDGNEEFLRSKSKELKKIVFNSENKGIAIAQNQALKMIGENYDYIIKVDPDIQFVTKNWIDELIKISMECHDRIILSPFMDFCEKEDLTKKLGIERYSYKNMAGHKVGLTTHVGGMVRFAHSKIYQDYRWDENLSLHNLEDNLFSKYCTQCNYLLGYVEDIIAIHNENEHVKDYKKYYKMKHVNSFINPNRKYGPMDKFIVYLKALNFYYSDFGLGAKTNLGKALIRIKRLLKGLIVKNQNNHNRGVPD